MKKILFFLGLLLGADAMAADYSGKMSDFVKEAAEAGKVYANQVSVASGNSEEPRLVALVGCSDTTALADYGCRIMAQWDNIYAVSMPLTRINDIAALPEVEAIQASEVPSIQTIKTASVTGQSEVWEYQHSTTTGFTGKGVLVGVVDVGFDMTHPTFMTADLSDTRIKFLWDMLDNTTGGSAVTGDNTIYSNFPNPQLGRIYVGSEAVLNKKQTADATLMYHGTHVASIAAGNGAPALSTTHYSGMAPEADLCLVAVATTDNKSVWSTLNDKRYNYSSAMLLVAYKYLFDYASAQGKPCVINASLGQSDAGYYKGSPQDYNYQMQIIDKMLSVPGHIICAAAGNNGEGGEKTITFPASAEKVIAVGNVAYSKTFTSINGNVYSVKYSGEANGERYYKSGQGPTATGLVKPDVMAPGTCINAAMNSYCPLAEGNPQVFLVGDMTYNGKTYQWLDESGTSMSSPCVAGIVATWLQMCPTLTASQVKEVIANTSTHYEASGETEWPNNRYGYGTISGIEGLKYIERVYTGIEEIAVAERNADNSDPHYYDLQGREISEGQAHDGMFLVRQGGKTIKIAR